MAEPKRLEQGERIMEEFVKEFRRIARGWRETTGGRVQNENKYHNTLEAYGVRTAAQLNRAVI